MNKKTVIITAHEFSPYLGSECGMGWNLVNNLSKSNNIIVCHASTNQFNTEKYEEQLLKYKFDNEIIDFPFETISISQPIFSLFFGYINRQIFNRVAGIGFPPLYWLGVYFWELKLYKHVLSICRNRKIDIIHHLNHISFREPGFLWKIPKPYIVGPISGFVKIPEGYTKSFDIKSRIINSIRNLSNHFQMRGKRFKNSINKAKQVFYVSPEDYIVLSKYTDRLKPLLDVGTADKEINFLNKKRNYKKLKLLCVGRIDRLKNVKAILVALSRLNKRQNVELSVIGIGPDLKNLKILANKMKLDNVNWLGQLPRNDVIDKMKEHDLLVHLSIKEATSSVILESLENSLPVLCHDAFGASTIIDKSCGFKVPLIDELTTIKATEKIISVIMDDRIILNKMRKGAFLKSKDLTWKSLSKKIDYTYKNI